MESQTYQFDFTLGPVQDFIAQARRTRDFWAGSFLLSWLSGVAMAATEKLGGTIEFPNPPAGYLDWITTGNGRGEPPRQGAIPNRFKASVPEDFEGRIVEKAVRDAWIALAEHVWKQDIAPRGLSGEETKLACEVWDRQYEAFWEIAWVITDRTGSSGLLDRRKNWRSHLPPAEPGMKCHLMEGWQELSGIVGMDNEARRDFWKKLTIGRETDFREAERLCAIAYVKRRFVRYFDNFKKPLELSGDLSLNLKGWTLPVNQPSVVYMAAVHWLDELLKQAGRTHAGELQALLKAGQKLYDEGDEWESNIRCLVDTAAILEQNGKLKDVRHLIALDGSLFFNDLRLGLLKEFKDALKDKPEAEQARRFQRKRESVEEFGNRLQELSERLDKKLPEQPTPFYAVLAMDGDKMGEHLGKPENQSVIPLALDRFTAEAGHIVRENNGSLVYAGGDDVLAILPLEDALACALALRTAFLCAFAAHKPKNSAHPIPTSLSGAVIFAHVKTPLGEVLRQSHHVLDHIAKTKTGRDALAVRVLKPGGEHLTWAQPWEKALDEGRLRLDGSFPWLDKTETRPGGLVKVFLDTAQGSAGFSGKFFFRARERLKLLDGEGLKPRQRLPFTRDERIGLLRGDFLASEPPEETYPTGLRGKEHEAERKAWLGRLMNDLIDHCTVYVRHFDPDNGEVRFDEDDRLSTDALMLVRFLAHKGVEPHGQ